MSLQKPCQFCRREAKVNLLLICQPLDQDAAAIRQVLLRRGLDKPDKRVSCGFGGYARNRRFCSSWAVCWSMPVSVRQGCEWRPCHKRGRRAGLHRAGGRRAGYGGLAVVGLSDRARDRSAGLQHGQAHGFLSALGAGSSHATIVLRPFFVRGGMLADADT